MLPAAAASVLLLWPQPAPPRAPVLRAQEDTLPFTLSGLGAGTLPTAPGLWGLHPCARLLNPPRLLL